MFQNYKIVKHPETSGIDLDDPARVAVREIIVAEASDLPFHKNAKNHPWSRAERKSLADRLRIARAGGYRLIRRRVASPTPLFVVFKFAFGDAELMGPFGPEYCERLLENLAKEYQYRFNVLNSERSADQIVSFEIMDAIHPRTAMHSIREFDSQ